MQPRRTFLQRALGGVAASSVMLPSAMASTVMGSGCDPRDGAAPPTPSSGSNTTTAATAHPSHNAAGAAKESTVSRRQPVIFVGHGSPMNALGGTAWSDGWRTLGEQVFREFQPRAILSVSAHWVTDGTLLTAQQQPPTIHDFGGFPRPLYEMQYAAPGAPALAKQVAAMIDPENSASHLDEGWGLDHGTWSVLVHLRAQADIPVVQLSLSARASADEHIALGEQLRTLRDDGVLIFATGNVTHNLRHAMQVLRGGGSAPTPDWASTFDKRTAEAAQKRDLKALSYALDDDVGRLSHPTAEHWLPVVYAVAASDPGERVGFPAQGFDAGSLSMRSMTFGV